MSKLKKILALSMAAVMMFSLSACGSGQKTETSEAAGTQAPAESSSTDKTFTVGICQLVQHPALDAATKGFREALEEEMGSAVTFDGQCNTCSAGSTGRHQ